MQRGSDKHGPRLDEALEQETQGLVRAGRQTHAQEWKQAEPSGEDEPDVDRVPDGTLAGGTPEGLTDDDVEARAELATYLPRSLFPAVRELLIDAVMKNEAPDHVVREVKRLPAGREFANVGAVWEALGHHNEEQRF